MNDDYYLSLQLFEIKNEKKFLFMNDAAAAAAVIHFCVSLLELVIKAL